MFIFQIIVKIRIHHQTRSGTLYKLIYRGIFYPAFFLCACERSFETASFCLKFWLFLSRRPRQLILLIFSKPKRPFEKQTTLRLVTYLCISMDKIWAKIFWLSGQRNFDFARFLQTFALSTYLSTPFLVKQMTIKENALQYEVDCSLGFQMFNFNSGYVRVQLPRRSFVQISSHKYVKYAEKHWWVFVETR